METDPDSIAVSSTDRVIAKCAGAHVNQARKFSPLSTPANNPERDIMSGGAAPAQTAASRSPQADFHQKMADFTVEKAADKDKVRELANAYSARWGRVAGADQTAGRAYAGDLAQACRQNDIPVVVTEYSRWQAQQEAKKQKQIDDVRREAEESQKRILAEQETRRAAEAKQQEEARQKSIEASSAPAVSSAPGKEVSLEDKLKELKRLSDSGLISQDVYLERQRLILDGKR